MSRLKLTNTYGAPTLNCLGITKTYQTGKTKLAVLDDFSLTLNSGELGMLMGASGCGKTTLLMIAGGILIPDEGLCEINGHNIYKMLPEQKVTFRASYISFIFQHLHLFPALSAVENVALPLLIDAVSYEIAYQKAKEMMIRLGLKMHIDSKLDALSGGQKQRVAIGRGLIRESSLILCDEPTSNLDKESSDLVFSLIKEYAQNKGCSFLISTHDYRIISHANKVLEFKGLNDYQVSYNKEAVCEKKL